MQFSQTSALGGSIGHHALTSDDNVCVLGPRRHMGQFFHISLLCTGLPDISLPLLFFSARNIVILPEAHCRQGKAGLSHMLLLHREVFSAMAKKKHVSFL